MTIRNTTYRFGDASIAGVRLKRLEILLNQDRVNVFGVHQFKLTSDSCMGLCNVFAWLYVSYK
jgi:hypothetical protein